VSGEARAYPLGEPTAAEDDTRFTIGLLRDVADVLERHGYPPVRAALDTVDLRQALYSFIYVQGRC
jgi:hypothetical protein